MCIAIGQSHCFEQRDYILCYCYCEWVDAGDGVYEQGGNVVDDFVVSNLRREGLSLSGGDVGIW